MMPDAPTLRRPHLPRSHARPPPISPQERDVKIHALERSLSEARRSLKSSEGSAESASQQGRADR